ncbi:uncharacterized protein Tco025E_06157 [Trypanosoma conorhini]|uniref:Uncharacterized protein n=1 Tax=Trypanosoma conorhini TaxID=83891 RepID=A0A3R7P7D7_9TRYP|nr:uncharacterized protein Tco025E_06157 [Trypanosoma conorhini]RNF13907.1 hypothetical protein Tco025E_06157 [Trypanosoma conorhini]
MSTAVRHALRRLGAPPTIAAAVRHAGWRGRAPPPPATPASGHDKTAVCEPRRWLFKNQKTFPVGEDARLHADDVTVAEKNRKLFADAAAHEGPEASGDDAAMPTAAELDKLLPSATQLQEEIPSAAAVREAMRKGGDAAMWQNTGEDEEP